MLKTANTSLAQITKTEEQKENMIEEAQKTRATQIAQKQSFLQKKYEEAEDKMKEAAQFEISTYKDEISHEYKNSISQAVKDAAALKVTAESKTDFAASQGVKIVSSYLGV